MRYCEDKITSVYYSLLGAVMKGRDKKMGEAQPPFHENLHQTKDDEARTCITILEGQRYGPNSCVPPNLYVEILR